MEIKVVYLKPFAEFMQAIALKPKESRRRSLFVKAIAKRLEDVAEWQQELLKEYTVLGDDGELKPLGDGTYKLIEGKEADFHREQSTMLSDIVEIDVDERTADSIRKILENYEGDLNGSDAEVYFELCELFEVS